MELWRCRFSSMVTGVDACGCPCGCLGAFWGQPVDNSIACGLVTTFPQVLCELVDPVEDRSI